MQVLSKAYLLSLLLCSLSCTSSGSKASAKKEAPQIVGDILDNFKKIPLETQKKALENGWVYFSYAFQYPKFQQDLLAEFPSLNIFGSKSALLGKTPLDLRLLNKTEINPIALLLAIDLEMEILSRFHSNQQMSPRCLEGFWNEWNLPVPRSQAGTSPLPARGLSRSATLETAPEVTLNERSSRLAVYLRQSLGLSAETKLKLLSFEDPIRAQFSFLNTIGENEVYEIFSAPIECKSLQEKKYIIPLLGKMKCLQKQSASWITVSAKESTVVSDDWVSEVKQRCEKWSRPLSDQVKKESLTLKNSPLARSWSLYPRLRNFVVNEANRYEASFRKAL